MKKNIITMTDSYKFTHYNQYPENTEAVYSYFEARSGARYNKTIFFGLQYYLEEYLQGQVVTANKIEEAAKLSKAHFGSDKMFNRAMWEYILYKNNGFLPIVINAVPEGTPVPVNNVLMTVQNLSPICAPLTNHLETILSQILASSTVATLSYEVFKLIQHYRQETGTMDFIKFGLHDFGYRGVSSVESAGLCGAGHLLNFLGTDTVKAMELAMEYYNAPLDGLAYSVAATEHSVMTSQGREGEEALFGDLLKKYPEGILSVVIDSYDYRNFIDVIARKYKDQILARKGKVVFRPDSGDPIATTIDVLNLLKNVFGGTTNPKGYCDLNPAVGMLWGDGIDYTGIRDILFAMKNNNYSTNNIVFGMGGGLLQKINRDVQRFAFKSSAQLRNGIWHDIYKQPLDSSKNSKKGFLKLVKNNNGEYETRQIPPTKWNENSERNELVEVFNNGVIRKEYTFDEVRKNTGTW
jgi:nicotinamide phosphoribosyltransferase